jgi:3-hydroxyisobutyrate dehydrogenase-like beta-hydroxyacid dehydrogenase
VNTGSPSPVTVLGLGAMGSALARAFLAAGHPTTVWNRSPGRAGALEDAGAAVAAGVPEAVAASPLTVVCLLDTAAVDAVLDAAGDTLAGTTVVNLTSSTPEDARAVAGRVAAAGGRYVDGTVMVPTPMVGTDEGLVLCSGDVAAFAEHRGTLAALGELDLLGDDPGLAAVHDLGMLDVFFTGMTAFLHAAAVAGADGVRAGAFLPYARRMLALLDPVFAQLARDVDRGGFPGDEDTLAMELAALEHIVATSRARGVDPSVAGATRDLVRAAVDAGHGKDGFSRVVTLLRPAPR